jgi:hypothetical protein
VTEFPRFRRFDAHANACAPSTLLVSMMIIAHRLDGRSHFDSRMLGRFFALMLLALTTLLLVRMLARFDTWWLGQY